MTPRLARARLLINCAKMCVILLYLSGSTWQGLAQFVNVTAEINTIHWLSSKAVSQVSTVQCVVGMDSWQIREEAPQYGGSTYTNWFTGSHLIERSRLFPQDTIPNAPPPEWVERTNIVASVDGNPSGPRKFEDRMGEEGRMAWLALCSGSYLKREGREIFPPAFSWKFEICLPSPPTGPLLSQTRLDSQSAWTFPRPTASQCSYTGCQSPRICSGGSFHLSSTLFSIVRSMPCVPNLPTTTLMRGWWTGPRLARSQV